MDMYCVCKSKDIVRISDENTSANICVKCNKEVSERVFQCCECGDLDIIPESMASVPDVCGSCATIEANDVDESDEFREGEDQRRDDWVNNQHDAWISSFGE